LEGFGLFLVFSRTQKETNLPFLVIFSPLLENYIWFGEKGGVSSPTVFLEFGSTKGNQPSFEKGGASSPTVLLEFGS
jgi:hypothetical protein